MFKFAKFFFFFFYFNEKFLCSISMYAHIIVVAIIIHPSSNTNKRIKRINYRSFCFNSIYLIVHTSPAFNITDGV